MSNTDITTSPDDSRALEYARLSPFEQDRPIISLWIHGKSKKTQDAYKHDLHTFYHEIGKPLTETTLFDIQRFADILDATRLQEASKTRTLAALKSVLTFGSKMNMLPTNVGAMFKLPKLEDKLAERIMSEKNVQDMLRLETNKRNHAILTLLYYGGLRVSELCNLTWRNLHERNQAGQISVFGKGRKTRHVLLDSETWIEIWSLRNQDPLDSYVFTSRQATLREGEEIKNNRLDASRIHQIVRDAADRAGIAIGKVSPHWLRHAHATYALENGAPITLVKDTLGHASIETTARYTHVRPNSSSSTYLRKRSTL